MGLPTRKEITPTHNRRVQVSAYLLPEDVERLDQAKGETPRGLFARQAILEAIKKVSRG